MRSLTRTACFGGCTGSWGACSLGLWGALSCGSSQVDKEPLEQGRSAGEGVPALRIEHVVSIPGIGTLSDLALADEQTSTLLVAGTCGFAEVDVAKQVVLHTRLWQLPCPPLLESRIVDMDADGEVEFARFASGCVGPTAVLDREGRVRWQSPLPGACSGVVDLDGE